MKNDLVVLGDGVKTSWQRFLDTFEPVRPELHRYCRHLTRSPWDAEDLVQDTLARAFVTLGTMFHEVPQPRAWLFRVASNLWIDRARRARREVLGVEQDDVASNSSEPRAMREAAGALMVRLAPQERAAVVLKDVLDLSLEEIAESLSTTVGSVKAALHRGRGKLATDDEPSGRAPAPGVLDAFQEAFDARDVDRLAALLLDGAIVEIVGVVTEYGPDMPRDPRTGSFAGSLSPITYDERGGVRPEHLEGYRGGLARCEVRTHRGEPILVFWYDHEDGPAVRALMTVETEGDRIARLRNYFFSPDVIAEVCRELGLPFRVNGYRYW
ncbi:sigma-70 family RNA polymerase sigma factor [Sandaracinus amylolyticus]|uniref:sigma-70 family RNA polymerase sigma factor n=1 Tax=Sandaracinus amylolyticus TaxID=927083 RepID=UPI001F4472D4|nr:sigma-70 family RNA polymerase sigma factor [Sandaracinus amylolyticus]UJR85744.1 Hypothetical protein I5071_78240 [Sandaracinus amylolyticus]